MSLCTRTSGSSYYCCSYAALANHFILQGGGLGSAAVYQISTIKTRDDRYGQRAHSSVYRTSQYDEHFLEVLKSASYINRYLVRTRSWLKYRIQYKYQEGYTLLPTTSVLLHSSISSTLLLVGTIHSGWPPKGLPVFASSCM